MSEGESAFRRARRRGRGTWWQASVPAAVDLVSVLEAFGPRRGPASEPEHADVELDRIVGTAARPEDFDREMNPRSGHLRDRWVSVHEAQSRGDDLGCVSLVRVGDLYLVDDGHHRVSVARALGRVAVPACVRRVCTARHACLACVPADDTPPARGEPRYEGLT